MASDSASHTPYAIDIPLQELAQPSAISSSLLQTDHSTEQDLGCQPFCDREPLSPCHKDLELDQAGEFDVEDGFAFPRYAKRKWLKRYILEADPSGQRASSRRGITARRSGMLVLQLGAASIVVAINTALTIWTLLPRPGANYNGGVGDFLPPGDCQSIATLNAGLHVLLNILSSAFLGAGNYCMQVLAAPTAAEVDKAHKEGDYYDIGAQSIHNLKRLRPYKLIVWLLLGLVSTLLHLAYNSAIFSSFPLVTAAQAAVTSDFLYLNDDWMVTRPTLAHKRSPLSSFTINDLRVATPNMTRLNKTACMTAFIDPLQATQDLIVVTRRLAANNNGSSLMWATYSNGRTGWDGSSLWICSQYEPKNYARACPLLFALTFADNWLISQEWRNINDTKESWWLPDFTAEHLAYNWWQNVTVDYCLVGAAGDNEARCGFHYSAPLMLFVLACTTIEFILIALIALQYHQSTHKRRQKNGLVDTVIDTDALGVTLVLLGDVIAAALRETDESHTRIGLSINQPSKGRHTSAKFDIRRWEESQSPMWFKAVGPKTWLVSVPILIAGLGTRLALLAVVMNTLRSRSLSTASFWTYGLGKVNQYLLASQFLGYNATVYVLFANAFQLLISFLYMFINNILTRQLVANEFLRYMEPKAKKSLRVSEPKNSTQRSSYYLSIPWKYGIPQTIAFIALHWIVSQSVFIVRATSWTLGPDGHRIFDQNRSRVGFSPLGIFWTSLLGALLLACLFGNSFRRYPKVPTWLPRMATNSSGIAACCQRPKLDKEAYLYPLRLGVVTEGLRGPSTLAAGRITFSTDRKMSLRLLEDGTYYEQAVWLQRKGTREVSELL